MAQRLVTHHRPHIDDICGIWLFRRFHPEGKNAKVQFVSSSEKDSANPKEWWIGVGRGRFDEHKGDMDDCATSLVHSFLHAEMAALPPARQAALRKIVAYVKEEDMGKMDVLPDRELHLSSLLRTHFTNHGQDSKELVEFGCMLLDDVLASFEQKIQLEEDWTKRYEFHTPWGKAVALETAADNADAHAYRQGFSFIVLINPARKFRAFRADPHSSVDFSAAFAVVKTAEPKADWFLHHSKKLLLCGSDVAPDAHLSKLTLEDLVRAVQTLE